MIYKKPNGRFAVRVDIDDRTGKRQRTSVGTYQTQSDAKKAERDALQAVDEGKAKAASSAANQALWERFVGEVANGRKHTLTPGAFGRFIDDLAETEKRAAAPAMSELFADFYEAKQIAGRAFNTTRRYEQLWRIHANPLIGAISVADLKSEHLEALYAAMAQKRNRKGKPLSARTVHHTHRMLHTFLAWAAKRYKNDAIEKIAGYAEAPSPSKSHARDLTAEEALQIIGATEGDRWQPYFVTAIKTGLRRGELAGLAWADVDVDRAVLIVRHAVSDAPDGGWTLKSTKTNRVRAVPLAADVVAALRAVKVRQARERLSAGEKYRDHGFVFADEFGEPDLDGATKAFTKVARSLGIEGATLHSTRHGVATIAISEGVDILTVSKLLGHANPNMTLGVYGHLVNGATEAAVGTLDAAFSKAQARREANGRG